MGADDGHGYGATYYRGKPSKAHRVSWALHYGDIPAGLDVMHQCDNPPCCRPDHLVLGAHAANMGDMARKGRGNRATVTPAQVREIQAALNAGEGQVSVSTRLGIPRHVIVDIAIGKAWTWITGGGTRTPGRGRKKLTPEKVAAIRAGLARGEKRATLAARFGVHVSMISNIVRGKQWATP